MTHKEAWAISLINFEIFGRKLKEPEAQTIFSFFLLDRRKIFLGKKKENVEWIVNRVTGTEGRFLKFLYLGTWYSHGIFPTTDRAKLKDSRKYIRGRRPTNSVKRKKLKKKNWDKAKTEYYEKQLRERKENGGGQEVLKFTG